MDVYLNQPPRVFIIIKIMAWLLISAIGIGLLLVFTLKIHETISFRSGQLFSQNAPIIYRAPAEAKLKQLLVKEGQSVQKGDTLLVLQNDLLLAEYQKAKEQYWLTLANINLLKKQIANLESKVEELQKQEKIIDSGFYTQRNSHSMELSALEQQISNLEESCEIAARRLEKDHELMDNGLLSRQKYQEKYQLFLSTKNELSDLQKQYHLRQSSQKGLRNTYSGQKHDWKLQLLANNFEYVDIKKSLLEEEARHQELGNNMQRLLAELNNMSIIAAVDGNVSNLFNTFKFTNFITKNTPLLTLTPQEEETFFAKFNIPQKSMSKVEKGQIVHFKVDAYNHYYYGILRGKVEHLARQDTSNNFYVLASISNKRDGFDLKSGFRISGDILIKERRLAAMLWERLLKK